MASDTRTRKETERLFAERTPEEEARLRRLYRGCSRREFVAACTRYAGLAAAAGLVVPHSFQLVNVARAAPAGGEEVLFRFAYLSDTHLLAKGRDHRFVKAALRAVEDLNALDPQPDFVLFGGDLAQLGRRDELALGRDILAELKAPLRMIVGEHDWYLDLGEAWRDLFGPDRYAFDHKGVHFVALNSVIEEDFWTGRFTPEERMAIVATLDDPRQGRFMVGEEQREWLRKDLERVDRKTPVVVFSHSPLYKYYRPWNFWTEDAEEVQRLLARFDHVTVIHGHTHQVLTNKVGHIHFHGLLSTAWPWPYAPSGLPEVTVQMDRPDPFDPLDGCGDGSVEVLRAGWVNKRYGLWDRNPRLVTARALETGKLEGPRGEAGPAY